MTCWYENGVHKIIINVKCFSDTMHYKYIIISIILIIFYFFVSIIHSKFCNEIGAITTNMSENFIRISSNYEILCLLAKIIIFTFYYFIKIKNFPYIMKLIYIVCIFLICIIISIYVYKYVYYSNNIVNYINYYGWLFCSWFSLFVIFKILFNLKDITSFIIIGWLIIFFIFYKANKMKEFLLLTESNIFELSNIKSIEIFKNSALNILANKNNIKSKIILYGIINNFEEFANNTPEINYHYQKLLNNKYLNSKYSKNEELPILSIIFILYTIQLDKLTNKDEIALHMSYFLINEFNNPTYAILLASKIKAENYINLYYKYLLTEDIKDKLIYKLNKKSNKNSIKYIQIGSSILYYLYVDLFKLKIYDAICSQIDYFDNLRDNNVTNKNIDNFLKTGNEILKTRNEIKIIWDKLIELNPFSDEPYKDYNLYLDSIIQDEILSKEELKKYNLIKNNKIDEKTKIYHSMFFANLSSVILADGHFSNGKILYASPNFPLIFTYNVKELLNITIDDLLPNVVQSFHKELIDEAIKYSNINFVFKNQINSLLKTKNGGLFNIKLFIKPIPNLRYGLTYFIFLQKIIDSNYIIVLDKDLRINGFSQITGSNTTFANGGRYNLTNGLFGYHIGLIIPDILTLIEYRNGEFNIIKKDLELKGYLYQVNKLKEIKNKVDIILGKIKSSANTIIDNNQINQIQIEDALLNINEEFNSLIKELSKDNNKPFSIFYKVKMYTFLEGKYKYYRVYINDDIITGNENDQLLRQRNDDMESKRTTKFTKGGINSENSFSKISKVKTKQIKKRIKAKKINTISNDNFNEMSKVEDFYIYDS